MTGQLVGSDGVVLVCRPVDRGVLTARGYDRVLRTAWTLSDLDGTVSPQREHMELALFLRQQGSGTI